MARRQLVANTTLYPVPVVLIACGSGAESNVFSLNRIASCNAEPPMICISVRPGRASHDLIEQGGGFTVNIPTPDLELVSDFVGSTTLRKTDKWAETGLERLPAIRVAAPLLAACPVNLECEVRQQIRLPSHSLFIAEVLLVHAIESVLDARAEVDYELAQGGLAYQAGVVRERPVERFNPQALLRQVHAWRERRNAQR